MIFVGLFEFTMEHPMIHTAIDTLSAKRSDGLSVSNIRLETLCLLVVGIASARTVNLSHLSGEMPTQAKVDSTTVVYSVSCSMWFLGRIGLRAS